MMSVIFFIFKIGMNLVFKFFRFINIKDAIVMIMYEINFWSLGNFFEFIF